jgi:hypothetical protein
MAPYVLVMMLTIQPGPGWTHDVIVLDMPSRQACEASLNDWRLIYRQAVSGRVDGIDVNGLRGFCATRDGKELVQ